MAKKNAPLIGVQKRERERAWVNVYLWPIQRHFYCAEEDKRKTAHKKTSLASVAAAAGNFVFHIHGT